MLRAPEPKKPDTKLSEGPYSGLFGSDDSSRSQEHSPDNKPSRQAGSSSDQQKDNHLPDGKRARGLGSPDKNPEDGRHDKDHLKQSPVPDIGDDKRASRQELDQAESDASSPSSEPDSKEKGLFSGDEEQKSGVKYVMPRPKKLLLMVMLGVTLGGSIAGFSVMHAPIKVYHSAMLLRQHFGIQESQISKRFTKSHFKHGRLERYQANQDVGETRVSWWGSKRYWDIMKQLEGKGITPIRANGMTMGVAIDTYLPDSPFTGQRSPGHLPGEAGRTLTPQQAIAKTYNVPLNAVQDVGGGRFYQIDVGDLSRPQAKAFAKSSVAALDGGKVQNAIAVRRINKFWGTPSLWHPFRAITARQQYFDAQVKTWASRKLANAERIKARMGRLKPVYVGAKERMDRITKGKVRLAITGAVSIGGIICLAYDLGQVFPAAVYEGVTRPGAEIAADTVGVAEQMVASDDIGDHRQIQMAYEGQIDEDGRDWFSSGAFRAKSSNSDGAGGVMLPAYLASGFAWQRGGLTGIHGFLGAPGGGAGELLAKIVDGAGDEICSPVGRFALLAGGLLLWATGGGGVVTKASQAVVALAFMGMMQFATEALSDKFVQDLEDRFAEGPYGGAVASEAFRTLVANGTAAGAGGVILEDEEIREIKEPLMAAREEEFLQKSFFARVFDIYDERSMLTSFVLNTQPGFNYNASNVATTLSNPLRMFGSGLSSMFSRKASAASMYDYPWISPLVSLPPWLTDSDSLEDPYENAEMIAELLKSDAIPAEVLERAKACWGVEYGESARGWDVFAVDEVEFGSEEYGDAECNNYDFYETGTFADLMEARTSGRPIGNVNVPKLGTYAMSNINQDNTSNVMAANVSAPAIDADNLDMDVIWARLQLYTFDTNGVSNPAQCYEALDSEVNDPSACNDNTQRTSTGIGDGMASGEVPIVDGFACPLKPDDISNTNVFTNGTTSTVGHPYIAFDFVTAPGAEVRSVSSGVVVSSDSARDRCGGRIVTVFDASARNGEGITYSYLHLSKSARFASKDTQVQPGDLLGYVGTAAEGCNTPHLHIDAVIGNRRPGCSRINPCSMDDLRKFLDIGPLLYNSCYESQLTQT
jgi:hypothetical protein